MPVRSSRRYDVEGLTPSEEVTSLPAGTNVLVTGPAHVGKAELGRRLLARAAGHDEDAVAVSTDGELAAVGRQFERAAGPDADSALYLVDCSQSPGTPVEGVPDGRVMELNSPADMTGIGIALAKYDEQRADAVAGTRVMFDSVTTLLQYVDPKRAYQFVDVVTGRFSAAGYLSVFLLDDTAVEDRAGKMFVHEFDAQVKLRETNGGREVSLRGFPGVSPEWRPYDGRARDALQ